MAPRARFELATLRLTAEECKNLNALFGVAYRERRRFLVPQLGYLGYFYPLPPLLMSSWNVQSYFFDSASHT